MFENFFSKKTKKEEPAIKIEQESPNPDRQAYEKALQEERDAEIFIKQAQRAIQRGEKGAMDFMIRVKQQLEDAKEKRRKIEESQTNQNPA